MTPLRKFCLQAIAAVVIISITNGLKYSSVKQTNASCFPKDSCRIAREVDSVEDHNCDCNSSCELYKTCCIDSPYLNHTRRAYRHTSCVSLGKGPVSVFMIDTCHNSYDGPTNIRKKCEESHTDFSDPLAYAPLTDIDSHTTYKSIFCAICNFEKPRNLVMWQVVLDCSSLGDFMHFCTKNRDFVLNNIMFIKDKGMWGLWSWNKKSDWKFKFLPVSYHLPNSLVPYVKTCRPDLTSDCALDWEYSDVKKLCKSYMGAVYFPNVAFRNVHCALCNRVKNLTEMSCSPIYSSPFRSSTSVSFGLLLDIDLSDGETVGTVKKCDENQVFDPLFKKCRSLECPIPGFELKDEHCVKE